ncbi:MAG: glycosyltransferase family 2 protein [Phycisphaerales bacterium]|nr:glycosyltransferase family 2 protein [Phycisphaerales bacterium]
MPSGPSILVAIPAHNEAESVDRVLPAALEHGLPVLLIDDGSTDRTAVLASAWPVELVRNPINVGYGRVMRDILAFGASRGFDWIITMDCDEQHEPRFIPEFVRAIRADTADVISGSRYLKRHASDQPAPSHRREINKSLTAEINTALGTRLGCTLTDSFCGFKAYRTHACSALHLDADGYDFPMQFWVQAAANRLRTREIAVPRLYLDPSRTFGDGLDDPDQRLSVYRATLAREIERCRGRLAGAAGVGITRRRTTAGCARA